MNGQGSEGRNHQVSRAMIDVIDRKDFAKNQKLYRTIQSRMRPILVFVSLLGLLFYCHSYSLVGAKPSRQHIDELESYLFPNRTASFETGKRMLAIVKPEYDAQNPVACSRCQGLSVCHVLNTMRVEEVYLPKQPSSRETCAVIEAFGKRIQGEVFGHGRTFRDTEQCREMVMQYLCLFYGSDNNQYRNYCVLQEDYSDPLPANHLKSARPPCRSFCVQVATVCANDPTFIHTCHRIACPPTAAECTPDPILGDQSLTGNLGCEVPYYRTPYNAATLAHSGLGAPLPLLFTAAIGFLLALAV